MKSMMNSHTKIPRENLIARQTTDLRYVTNRVVYLDGFQKKTRYKNKTGHLGMLLKSIKIKQSMLHSEQMLGLGGPL